MSTQPLTGMGRERRLGRRVSTQAQFLIGLSRNQRWLPRRKLREAQVVDLSHTGARLRCAPLKGVAVGTRLQLDYHHHTAFARVRWLNQTTPDTTDYGVLFIEIDPILTWIISDEIGASSAEATRIWTTAPLNP